MKLTDAERRKLKALKRNTADKGKKHYCWYSATKVVACGSKPAGSKRRTVCTMPEYQPWTKGKRETLAIIAAAPKDGYHFERNQAIRIAKFMNWID